MKKLVFKQYSSFFFLCLAFCISDFYLFLGLIWGEKKGRKVQSLPELWDLEVRQVDVLQINNLGFQQHRDASRQEGEAKEPSGSVQGFRLGLPAPPDLRVRNLGEGHHGVKWNELLGEKLPKDVFHLVAEAEDRGGHRGAHFLVVVDGQVTDGLSVWIASGAVVLEGLFGELAVFINELNQGIRGMRFWAWNKGGKQCDPKKIRPCRGPKHPGIRSSFPGRKRGPWHGRRPR